MTLTSTFSSLSTRTFISNNTTILPGGQYITSFTNANPTGIVVDTLYDAIISFNTGTMSYAIANNTGYINSQQTSNTSYLSSSITIDNSGNFYIGGYTSNSNPLISKFSGSTLIWSKTFSVASTQVNSIQTDTTGNIFVLSGSSIDTSPSLGALYFLSKFDSNGNLINQRKVLNSTSSSLSLGIDTSSSKIIVSGTDYAVSNHSAIVNGLYDFNNTSINNTIYVQSTPTANVFYNSVIGNDKIVSDSTFLYQIATRQVSGITYTVYMSISKFDGTIAYSNYLSYGGRNLSLQSIAYGNGYLYLLGHTSYTTGIIYIAKINPNTGAIVWQKSLTNSTGTYTHISNGLYYYNGFIYFNCAFNGTPLYGLTVKLKEDGSLSDGTYGSFYTFTTISATVTSLNSSNTNMTTDSTSTTTYSTTSPSISMIGSSYTVSTTPLP